MMTRIKRIIVNGLVGMFILSSPACGINLPTAKVTLKAIDENGIPLSGAKAVVTFEGAEMFTGKVTNKTFSGLTDKNGMYTNSSSTNTYVSYGVEMKGWYESQGEYKFKERQAGKWLPWNPEIKVVMRKIENPAPMYARNTGYLKPDIEIPEINKEIGFDLIECDWVAPYGNGRHTDFIFKLEKTFKSRDDFDSIFIVTFPNKFDGIQVVKENLKGGSLFKLPRYALNDGYHSKLSHRILRTVVGMMKDDYESDTNYIFRVRSEEKDGKLYRAMYGKINGEIRFDPMNSKTAYIIFKYFLNPDYTRNLEWSGENLFKNLKSFEQVRADN